MRGKLLPILTQVAAKRIIPAHAGQTIGRQDQRAYHPDHPRACGANWTINETQAAADGSSPRMRGKPAGWNAHVGYHRIIPAHAGQTQRVLAAPLGTPDHPRACGANTCSAFRSSLPRGSSPRMRGKRATGLALWIPTRIIPAHAGQTGACWPAHAVRPDHPRACGANAMDKAKAASMTGSSPRMRGKRADHVVFHGHARIIPAHAGQTTGSHARRFRSPDHPRACGANNVASALETVVSGSSPRMRGKPTTAAPLPRRHRIIPAHAGQTARRSHRSRTCPDHPRACGANRRVRRGGGHGAGSSPRMRGKPSGCSPHPWEPRIIPAHAGQTRKQSHRRRRKTDHPRACGANLLGVGLYCGFRGSSPRMRGKQLHTPGGRTQRRIIPAHAGQTKQSHRRRRRKTDHPRACGANAVLQSALVVAAGSSPRMRGKPRPGTRRSNPERIIPAHAGQTHAKRRRQCPVTDHPRACGANFAAVPFGDFLFGSSPRMRGKQSDFMRKLLSAGPSIIGFAQWLQSSYYCSCLQSSAKTPISRGTTPTSLFLGFQNSITLLLLT